MDKALTSLLWVYCGFCLAVIMYEGNDSQYDLGYDDGYNDRGSRDSLLCEMEMARQKRGFDRAMEVQKYMCDLGTESYRE